MFLTSKNMRRKNGDIQSPILKDSESVVVNSHLHKQSSWSSTVIHLTTVRPWPCGFKDSLGRDRFEFDF